MSNIGKLIDGAIGLIQWVFCHVRAWTHPLLVSPPNLPSSEGPFDKLRANGGAVSSISVRCKVKIPFVVSPSA
ncbi:MAG TPA: hypothetical protein DCM17_00065, partial [Dehalococcoidia bacterium]|nr:hypothetical protein [Dehalococcoidia bacterium]